MSTSDSTETALRFASLRRVSTEEQKKPEASLANQKDRLAEDARYLGGEVVAEYGGVEHATPGDWESPEVSRLLADAALPEDRRPGRWNAILVKHEDRWSRDNRKSEEGLDVLRENGVRFFVRTREYDLFNEDDELRLTLDVAFARRQARSSNRRSMETRLRRAEAGWPAVGKLPYGRAFDPTAAATVGAAAAWSIVPAKQEMILDIATRYLKGENFEAVVRSYGKSHSSMHRILYEQCGETWVQHFRNERLRIDRAIVTPVPRLLPQGLIDRVIERFKDRRPAFLGRTRKYDFLLNCRVFCGGCGYALTGQLNTRGTPFYRHSRNGREKCSLRPRPWVRADRLDAAVVDDLFHMFGNPAEIERCVKAATPDCGKLVKQQARLRDATAKIATKRGNLVRAIEEGLGSFADIRGRLAALAEEETKLRAELARLDRELEDVNRLAGGVEPVLPDVWESKGPDEMVYVFDQWGEQIPGGSDLGTWLTMSPADKRALVDATFSGTLPDGKKAGVYVYPAGGGPKARVFTYELRGRLNWKMRERRLDPADGLTPQRRENLEKAKKPAPKVRKLGVTESATGSPSDSRYVETLGPKFLKTGRLGAAVPVG